MKKDRRRWDTVREGFELIILTRNREYAMMDMEALDPESEFIFIFTDGMYRLDAKIREREVILNG